MTAPARERRTMVSIGGVKVWTQCRISVAKITGKIPMIFAGARFRSGHHGLRSLPRIRLKHAYSIAFGVLEGEPKTDARDHLRFQRTVAGGVHGAEDLPAGG